MDEEQRVCVRIKSGFKSGVECSISCSSKGGTDVNFRASDCTSLENSAQGLYMSNFIVSNGTGNAGVISQLGFFAPNRSRAAAIEGGRKGLACKKQSRVRINANCQCFWLDNGTIVGL